MALTVLARRVATSGVSPGLVQFLPSDSRMTTFLASARPSVVSWSVAAVSAGAMYVEPPGSNRVDRRVNGSGGRSGVEGQIEGRCAIAGE